MADIEKWDYMRKMSERYHDKCHDVKRYRIARQIPFIEMNYLGNSILVFE